MFVKFTNFYSWLLSRCLFWSCLIILAFLLTVSNSLTHERSHHCQSDKCATSCGSASMQLCVTTAKIITLCVAFFGIFWEYFHLQLGVGIVPGERQWAFTQILWAQLLNLSLNRTPITSFNKILCIIIWWMIYFL